ncbi:hypothetical protein EIK77_003520 [Talaromyces pinophilus]|nr:hypothetical protein EIK77_003520 [Talaromyces pinophilus]PCG98945.1 hypothetical protein PENOC_060550 [Penicillium occitanis (nom. inval.)]PCH02672.1 Hypothetical protein PENO1_036340 [Penicillium occitanis (nom. inval.)]
MASTQPSPTNLIPRDYIRIFKEGYDLSMPPHDFRVWDRYLFSKLPDAKETPRLLKLFTMVIKGLRGVPEQNIRTVGQWCEQGTFFDEAMNVIDSTTRDIVCQDFLEANKAIFKAKPLGLSEVQTILQTRWFEQAKACITFIDPFPTNPETVNTLVQERKEAYFAFGVVVWRIMPEPDWVEEDACLDVWYNLGFAIAPQPEQRTMLFEGYQKQYSETCGASKTTFESFFRCFSNGSMFDQLGTGWDTTAMSRSFCGNLEIFLLNKKYHQQDASVWRLHHWTYISDKEVISMKGRKDWGVFEKARVDYALKQHDAEIMFRKDFWAEVLKSLEDPLDLHHAIKNPGLHEYLKKWCAEHNKPESIVDRIYCKNPILSH